ncbi:Chemotaxis protein CheD [gamma proteobacterium HdN1]|nr:Chemotaxis protein CheD [gamma proteobacterium HdN1]
MQQTIVLMPGEFYFGDRTTVIKTLLGSCVSIVLWHPQKKIGGMCHFVLPSRKVRGVLDGRYADEAMELFLISLRARHTEAPQYRASLYGGANMIRLAPGVCCAEGAEPLAASKRCTNVACLNQREARTLLQRFGFSLVEQDMGGNTHRMVEFDVGTGKVKVQRGGNCPQPSARYA